jgi:hypothetical protein
MPDSRFLLTQWTWCGHHTDAFTVTDIRTSLVVARTEQAPWLDPETRDAEAQANAQFIADAPHMYRALYDVLAWFDEAHARGHFRKNVEYDRVKELVERYEKVAPDDPEAP